MLLLQGLKMEGQEVNLLLLLASVLLKLGGQLHFGLDLLKVLQHLILVFTFFVDLALHLLDLGLES